MTTHANQHGCLYMVSGLDNVRLLGYPLAREPGAVKIERINVLHKVIALGIVQRPGPLMGREIRYLRTELGFTPEDLADLIDTQADLIRTAENRLTLALPLTNDVELRRLIYTHFDLEMPLIQTICARSAADRTDDFFVEVTPDAASHWKLAA